MALITDQIVTRCMGALRLPDVAGTQRTRVLDTLNEVYRDIMAKYQWYWLLKRGLFNTTAMVVRGTINVEAGNTQATLSAPPAISLTNGKLVIASNVSDSATYRIANSTTTFSTISLDAAFTNATAASQSYTVYFDEYSLATDSGRILWMKRYGFTRKL